MTHTLDEAGARECLAATPHGDLCPQKSSTGFCNCDHRLRAMLAFAASQAETKAVGEDVVERVARIMVDRLECSDDGGDPVVDFTEVWTDIGRHDFLAVAREIAAIAAMSPSPDTVTMLGDGPDER